MSSNSLVGITPMKGSVFIDIYDNGEEVRTYANGAKIIILSDTDIDSLHKGQSGDYRHRGDRARWARIVALSQDAIDEGMKLGDDILAERLEWSRGVAFARTDAGEYKKFWRLPVDKIAGVRNHGDQDKWAKAYAETLKTSTHLFNR